MPCCRGTSHVLGWVNLGLSFLIWMTGGAGFAPLGPALASIDSVIPAGRSMQSQELFGGSEKMNKASGSTSFSQPCWFPWIIMSQPHPEPGKGKEGGASGAPFTKSVSFRHHSPPSPSAQCWSSSHASVWLSGPALTGPRKHRVGALLSGVRRLHRGGHWEPLAPPMGWRPICSFRPLLLCR